MNWGIEDFFAAALLIGGAAAGVALVLKRVLNPAARIMLAVGVILIAMGIWAHLAVGIFD